MAVASVCLLGLRFGKLVVESEAEKPSHRKGGGKWWLCQCDCGGTHLAPTGTLKAGRTVQCRKCRFHGHTAGGESRTYRTWRSMRERCQNPNSTAYGRYGARGITVCDRWQKLENFIEDMGLRPDGKTLDRIDYDKGYFPENCRWATPYEQARNTSATKLTAEKVVEIKRLISEGVTEPSIARQFGLTNGYVNNIRQGLAWADIPMPEMRTDINPDLVRLRRLLDQRSALDIRIEKLTAKLEGFDNG